MQKATNGEKCRKVGRKTGLTVNARPTRSNISYSQARIARNPEVKKMNIVHTAGNSSGIVDGGAIALGHPLGATGVILLDR